MDASQELIDRINQVKENEVVRLASNLIMWKEGSTYDLEVTNRQFDDLEILLEKQEEKPFYIVDLSVAKRPPAEMVQLVEERIEPIKDKFKHAAVYTGSNYIMFLGVRFYFIRFKFPSYSAHKNLKSIFNSFSDGGN